MHTWSWNQISRIYDQRLNTNSAKSCSNIQTRTQCSYHPEKSIHAHCNDIQNQKIREKLSRSPCKIRHKVENEIEDGNLDENHRNVRCELSQCEGCGSVKREGFM